MVAGRVHPEYFVTKKLIMTLPCSLQDGSLSVIRLILLSQDAKRIHMPVH